ncbi:heterokaryon incompatibility protein-domain-containing protein [Phyllosticta capitalensis]|uniref:Heterokaryon incompatibility protein-domain-containing protein n=1 Tax=Phyllosticta capitalensis TaxID=121624 RepID=A0ABR1YNU4_9PEZI
MSSQYEYSSLATPSTIRLIQVKKQKVNGVIDCAIRHVDYAKQPDFKYYALSYVWGDSSPTRQLYLTDPAGEKLILPIHENLWRFLNWAWNRGWHDHWIWTDRICLNQQDKEEMAQQIPRMGKTFANAEKVLSWLGMSEQEGLGLQARLEGATSQPVAPVLLNEYWSRVWIVQEVLNAKDVVVVVGNVEARLWDLKHRFHVLLNAECGILSLFNMRNQGLLGLLKAMSSDRYQCQRPHDRVYGIMGLVRIHLDGTSPVDYIEVDYDKPPAHALIDAVLESRPDPKEIFQSIREFWRQHAELSQKPLSETLMDYLKSEQTSIRHKRLFDTVCGFCNPSKMDNISVLFQSLRWKRLIVDGRFLDTVQDSAIMIGMSLRGEFDKERKTYQSECWKNFRKQYVRHSSWLCAAHGTSNRSRQCQVRGQSTIAINAVCRNIFKKCKHYHDSLGQQPSCDISEMTFEIPEVGFQLIINRRTQYVGLGHFAGLEGFLGQARMRFLHPDPAVQTTDKFELYKSMSERVDLPDDDDGDASVDESSIDESSVDYESPDDEYCVCKFAFCPSSVDESPIYEPSIYEDPSVNKSPPVDKPPAHNSSAAFNRLALKSSMKPNILRRIKERMRPRTKHADRRECRTQALDDEVLAEGSRDFVID